MALLVKHKQNIGLYDLGNSTRPVIGRTLFGRDKLGEAAGVTKIKEKRRFERKTWVKKILENSQNLTFTKCSALEVTLIPCTLLPEPREK